MNTPTPASFTGGLENRPPEEAHAHARLDDDGNPWRPDPDDEDDAAGGWRGQLRAVFATATDTMRDHPMAAMGVALAAGFILGRVRAAGK